jgi:glycolate oxidase
MQLVIGSEGTLGIITKAVLRLYPTSEATITLIVPFDNRRDAISIVPHILRNTSTPLALEYVERDLVERTAKYLGVNWPVAVGSCYLIIVMAESDRDHVLSESMRVAELCRENTNHEVSVAESKRDQDNILRIRSNVYTALKSSTYDILDITVPTAELLHVIDTLENVADMHRVYLPVYGHAGDGNLHVHIMTDQQQGSSADSLREEIYEIATNAGGVITGEHGIGKTRIAKVQMYVSAEELRLMRSIKAVFDPNGIMNPETKIPN